MTEREQVAHIAFLEKRLDRLQERYFTARKQDEKERLFSQIEKIKAEIYSDIGGDLPLFD